MVDLTTLEKAEHEHHEWVRVRMEKLISELMELTAAVPNQGNRDALDEALARVRWLRAKAVDAGWNVG